MAQTSARQWLARINEPIKGLIFSDRDYDWDDTVPAYPTLMNRLLSVEEAAPLLDFTFDSSFGGAESYPMYVWTATRVYFVNTYDGSEWLASVPRHPGTESPKHHGEG